MGFKQNCAYQDNQGNYWFVRWVSGRSLSAGLLRFAKPEYLPGDGFTEYFFDSQTGKLQVSSASEDFIQLEDKVVLDYNINDSLFDIVKNCLKRICTRPANFEKFDMVYDLRFKIPAIILTEDELDNEFLVYCPLLGVREWVHASNLEFVYRPTKPVKSNAKSVRI